MYMYTNLMTRSTSTAQNLTETLAISMLQVLSVITIVKTYSSSRILSTLQMELVTRWSCNYSQGPIQTRPTQQLLQFCLTPQKTWTMILCSKSTYNRAIWAYQGKRSALQVNSFTKCTETTFTTMEVPRPLHVTRRLDGSYSMFQSSTQSIMQGNYFRFLAATRIEQFKQQTDDQSPWYPSLLAIYTSICFLTTTKLLSLKHQRLVFVSKWLLYCFYSCLLLSGFCEI